MALTAALVHRGRTIRKVKTGVRVEGGYQKGITESEWFRVRYDEGDVGETADAGGYRRRRGASLLINKRDSTGGAVDVQASDEIEIDRRDGKPTFVMKIDTVKPMIKKKAVLGYEASVSKVERRTSAS